MELSRHASAPAALLPPCEAKLHTNHTVLSLMFDDASSWPWNMQERGREPANPDAARNAISHLAEHGLVHRLSEFVWPTRTARRAAEIEIGS